MVLEKHAITGQLIQRRGIGRIDHIRPHAVPDDHDDVLGLAGPKCRDDSREQN